MGRVIADVAARTHPRGSTPLRQLCLLAAAALVGCLIGLALLAADRASWRGAQQASAVVGGRSDKGVVATSAGRQILLHLPQVPAPGTRLPVEISPDGRARPLSYRQTPAHALRSGVLLATGLTVLMQGYRYVVTRRAAPTDA